MKQFFFLLPACALLAFAGDHCPTVRSQVKLLTDKDADKVTTEAKRSNIAELGDMKVDNATNDSPRLKQERQSYGLECNVARYTKEPDGSYRAIIYSGRDSMAIELVDPNCADAYKSKFLSYFKNARTKFEQFKDKEDMKKKRFFISGVLFVNPSGRPGDAPNHVSLCPVLKFGIMEH